MIKSLIKIIYSGKLCLTSLMLEKSENKRIIKGIHNINKYSTYNLSILLFLSFTHLFIFSKQRLSLMECSTVSYTHTVIHPYRHFSIDS